MPTSSRIVIAGGTGFLGRTLAAALGRDGHHVVALTRRVAAPDSSPRASAGPGTGPAAVSMQSWTPDGTSGPWAGELDGAAAVINLAGESIGEGRWSNARKEQLRSSRLRATQSLVEAIAACATPPPVFVSASAVGYYGMHDAEVLDETAPAGDDFLARLCVEWEAAAHRAASPATRVVILRSGLVLDRAAGALPRMLAPFRFFVGGPVGSGRQYVSWIHRDDWVALVRWAIATPSVSGAVNATAPNPVPNAEFAKIVGRVLDRPAAFPAPAFAVRALFGEMGETLAIRGQRVVPARALEHGCRFRYPDLQSALADTLRK